jgi:GTP1/Obg family GTP-binding protein
MEDLKKRKEEEDQRKRKASLEKRKQLKEQILQQCKSVTRKKPSEIETAAPKLSNTHMRHANLDKTDRSASHNRKDAFFLTGKSKTLANIDSVKKAYGITDDIQTPKYFRRVPNKLPAMIKPVSRDASQEMAAVARKSSWV